MKPTTATAVVWIITVLAVIIGLIIEKSFALLWLLLLPAIISIIDIKDT